MFWSLSFQLMPDEEIIEDSTQKNHSKVKPAYSIILTNKRAIFCFDGLGSSLTHSFFYHEILSAASQERLFIKYLKVTTKKKDFFLNTHDPDFWSNKIMEFKNSIENIPLPSEKTPLISSDKEKKELLNMLTILKNKSLLTGDEFLDKIKLLEKIQN